jgi:glycine cleavage system aminomethyltransferase T
LWNIQIANNCVARIWCINFKASQLVAWRNKPIPVIREICSGTYSPSLEKSIGFARLPKGQMIGSVVQVCIRDQVLDAQIVKPAFVRRGQILI